MDMNNHMVDSHNIPGMEDMRDMTHKDRTGTVWLDNCRNHHKGWLHSPGIEAPLDTHPFVAAWVAAVAPQEKVALADNMASPVARHVVPRHAPGNLAPDMPLAYQVYQACLMGRTRAWAASPHYLI